MLTYTYTAVDAATGKKVNAEVQAQSESTAAKALIDRGLSPLSIRVKEEQKGTRAVLHHIPTKQKVIFSRQLSTLINAGLPLVQSLENVRDQMGNKAFQVVIAKVINDVEGGTSLADALARHPKVFNEIYISLVAAGETSGTLDKALERLANQQEKDAEIVAKIRGAMVYPIIVLTVLVGVIVFLMTGILPQVQSLYASLPGAELPILTRVLLAVAHFIINYWWFVIIAIFISGAILFRWARTIGGRSVIDNLKMHVLLIGPLFMKLYMARFARTASTLVASGVPMLKMLSTTASAVGNVHIAASINKASEQVKGGGALSDSLQGDKNFIELVPNMIRIGEQSGQLEQMLNKLADYYEKEVDNQIKAISTSVEPILMVIVGVMALLIVAAVLLPIYNLAGKNLIQ